MKGIRRLAPVAFVLLAACSSTAAVGDAGMTGTAGPLTGAAGPRAAGTTGAAGSMPAPDGGGTLSDAMPPHTADGGVRPVAPTPPAMWVNVTGNLAGMASECGNTSYLAAHPSTDMLITSVAKQGLWSSTDGGASWKQLWPAAGTQQITNRGSSMVFDPAHADTFWESGIYNGPGVYRTTDNGATFTALGDAHHIDSVSVDLCRPPATNAAGRRARAETYPLSLGRRRRHVDQRRREPARRHELLHERASSSTRTSTSWVARATRAAPTAFSAPPTAVRRGRPRRRHRRPRRRSGPPTARFIGRSSTTTASSRAPTRAAPGRRLSRAGC